MVDKNLPQILSHSSDEPPRPGIQPGLSVPLIGSPSRPPTIVIREVRIMFIVLQLGVQKEPFWPTLQQEEEEVDKIRAAR